MEEFKITFWKKPENSTDSFVANTESYITSATVTKSTNGMTEIFHVKLTDIGLDSLHGEFDIIRQDGFWQITDQDSVELQSLKWNIIEVLLLQLK